MLVLYKVKYSTREGGKVRFRSASICHIKKGHLKESPHNRCKTFPAPHTEMKIRVHGVIAVANVAPTSKKRKSYIDMFE